jgi:hypothetical protein
MVAIYKAWRAWCEPVTTKEIEMKTTTIDATCGIYDTEYTLRDYGKKLVVTAPRIKWENNSGCLDFKKTTITNPDTMTVVRAMFAHDELVTDDDVCLGDILEGNYGWLPRK